ncbi:hypothetical protein ENBRE01_0612 [Enteropsectra breve]|nr:hypothetical protein ENBRE01_0612 [Enteropsectra breve]
MPVLILIESMGEFAEELKEHFKSKYKTEIRTEHYKTIRSMLSNQKEDEMHIVPRLSKPERYEIFCLTRKNAQQFLSLAYAGRNEHVSSDKNLLLLEKMDFAKIEEELSKSWVSVSSANKRSKAVSLKGLSEIKKTIVKINEEYRAKNASADCVLKECEDRIVKLCSLSVNETQEDIERCYRKIVDAELEKRGLNKTQ